MGVRHHSNFRSLKLLVTAIAVAALNACGGDGAVPAPDLLERFRQQEVAWKNCDGLPADWNAQVVERTQCAALRVPMDYADPAGAEIQIGVMRVKALASETRAEPLFLNPGGPGGEGYLFGLVFAQALMDADEWTPANPNYQLQQRFDLIGFDPRGVGTSTALECASDAWLEGVDNSLAGRTPENIAAQTRNTQAIAAACAGNPLTRHIHTDATARDLDLMRQILGGEKLHFYGASYGTWLGLWYAGLFPANVGKMVLDSTADFTASLQDIAVLQGPALARTFKEVLAPYAARHADVFQLGSDVEAIRNWMQQLHPVVRAAAARNIYEEMFSSQSVPAVFDYLLAGNRLSQAPFSELWPQAMGDADFSALKSLVSDEAFSEDEEKDQVLREYAGNILQEIESKRQVRRIDMSEVEPVYTAVVCNDSWARHAGLPWWVDQETAILTDFPIAGTSDLRSCAGWPSPPPIAKPSMAAMQNLDILLLQSEFDGATPAQGALNTFAQLPAAHMVMVKGAMDHGVVLANACGSRHFAEYLLGRSPPRRLTECSAAPWAEDARSP